MEEIKAFRLARTQALLPLLLGQSDRLPVKTSLVEKKGKNRLHSRGIYINMYYINY